MRERPLFASDEQKVKAVKAIEHRMGWNFTFRALWQFANRECGFVSGDDGSPCYRLADRMIQKARREGRIEQFARVGSTVHWKPKAT